MRIDPRYPSRLSNSLRRPAAIFKATNGLTFKSSLISSWSRWPTNHRGTSTPRRLSHCRRRAWWGIGSMRRLGRICKGFRYVVKRRSGIMSSLTSIMRLSRCWMYSAGGRWRSVGWRCCRKRNWRSWAIGSRNWGFMNAKRTRRYKGCMRMRTSLSKKT